MRLNLPTPFLPYAEGSFPTPSGKCEFFSERIAALGFDPLPTYIRRTSLRSATRRSLRASLSRSSLRLRTRS